MDYGPRYANVGGGEFVMRYVPHGHREGSGGTRKLVLFCHGSGGDAQQIEPSTSSSTPGGLYLVCKELVRFGYVVASYTYSSTTNWGNSTSIAQLDTNLTYAASNFGVAVNKVAFLCYSMGHVTAANWARTNSAKVAAIVGVAPSTDVDYHYANGHSAAIDAAYGGSWATNGGNNFDPINSTASINSIPWKGYAGDSDTTVPPGDVSGGVQRYANTYGANASVSVVSGTHNTIWASVPAGEVAAFIHAGLW